MNNKNNKIRVNIIDLLIFSSVILPINLCTSDTNINSVLSKKPLSLRFKKSPSIYKPCGASLNRCFPGAYPGSVLHKTISQLLKAEGLTPENTIYGHSICSDEINNENGSMAKLFAQYWGFNGTYFPLGGIGGAPFVGKTGFGAFSSRPY